MYVSIRRDVPISTCRPARGNYQDAANDAGEWKLKSSVSFRDGAFHVASPRRYWAYQSQDGQVAIETEQVSRPGTKSLGLCFRLKRRGGDAISSGYWLLISSNGRWCLDKSDGETASPIRDWSQSTAIRTGSGARNSLAVVCRGPSMAVFINGQLVGEMEDSTYADAGGVGPICSSDQIEVAFRNLQIDPLAK